MKKRFLAILAALLLTVSVAMPAIGAFDSFAAERSHCIDYADQVADSTIKECNEKAASIKEDYGVDVVYVCVKDTNGMSDAEYARNFLRSYCGNAVILIDNYKKGTVFATSTGTGREAITETDLNNIESSYMRNESYSGAIRNYYTAVTNLLILAGIEPNANSYGSEVDSKIPSERALPLLNDEADLLASYEEREINALLEEISERQGMDVAICTVDHFRQNSVMEAADDYFDYNGFGQGPDHDGVLLYVCMDTRDMWISTTGAGINAFTDYGIDHILDEITPDMSSGYYADAFKSYANIADDFITRYENGEPFDTYSEPLGGIDPVLPAGISLVFCSLIGFLTGKVKVARERGKLKSVRYATEANNYLKNGSLNIRRNRATFLFTDVSRVYSPEKKSEGGGGGGSSTHFGGSGMSHGGGGGKF